MPTVHHAYFVFLALLSCIYSPLSQHPYVLAPSYTTFKTKNACSEHNFGSSFLLFWVPHLTLPLHHGFLFSTLPPLSSFVGLEKTRAGNTESWWEWSSHMRLSRETVSFLCPKYCTELGMQFCSLLEKHRCNSLTFQFVPQNAGCVLEIFTWRNTQRELTRDGENLHAKELFWNRKQELLEWAEIIQKTLTLIDLQSFTYKTFNCFKDIQTVLCLKVKRKRKSSENT